MANRKVTTTKSAVAYGLFSLFLGAFGVHKFYANKVGQGVALIILTSIGMTVAMIALEIPDEDAGLAVFVFFGVPALLGVLIWTFVDFLRGMCNAATPERIFK